MRLQTIDLVVFGNIYERVHRYKDGHSRTLGPHHRKMRHKWYQEFGHTWDFQNATPPVLIRRFKRALLTLGPGLDPDELRRLGVDVISETIQRQADGREVWENAPGLRQKYERLRQKIWRGLSVNGSVAGSPLGVTTTQPDSRYLPHPTTESMFPKSMNLAFGAEFGGGL